MKAPSISPIIFLFCISVALSSCTSDPIEEDTVLPFESYRYELWKNLIDHNYDFNFIGNKTDDYPYPDYLGYSFDREHQGVGGIETEGVLLNLNPFMRTSFIPDVVLLGIGTNDLYRGDQPQDIIQNILGIIAVLKNENPEVVILIEKIAPLHSYLMTEDLRARTISFNNLIDFIGNNFTKDDSSIIPVDMYTEFLDSYTDDGIHYNKKGAKFVADKYMDTLKKYFTQDLQLNILPLGDSRVTGYKPI